MTPELIAVHHVRDHLYRRTWKHECGHTSESVLKGPPSQCPTCKEARLLANDVLLRQRAVRAKDARRAREAAEKAHRWGKRHLICELCFTSRSVDALCLTEAHAGMFSSGWRGFSDD